MSRAFNISNEFDPLAHVVIGRVAGYHRNPQKVEIVNETQRRQLVTRGHPGVAQLRQEFGLFRSVMAAAGVTVEEPELAAESVQDQTCPRDIGFVIGTVFVAAGMRHASRREELAPLMPLLESFRGERMTVPAGVVLEGGDVVVHGDHLFVGIGQRSDPEGAAFLEACFGEDYRVQVLPTRSQGEGEEMLHLDRCFNPLGLGHALIYPQGLREIPTVLRECFDWIEVTRAEAAALATNVLSLAPDKVIARTGPDCARVNGALRKAGYQVQEIAFDGVPGTGGSFRAATLPLRRG